VDMDVGAADAGGLHPDEDLVLTDGRDGTLGEGEPGGGGGFDESAHREGRQEKENDVER